MTFPFKFHQDRLTEIYAVLQFVAQAMKERHAKHEEVVIACLKELDKVSDRSTVTSAREMRRLLNIADPAERLLLNLTLVILCTEFEVFIRRLIDTILQQEPRLLKSWASHKQIAVAEAAEAADKDAILQNVRTKVIQEIIDCNAKEMLTKHLGERFRLICEHEIPFRYQCPELQSRFDGWGLETFGRIFADRHRVVHEGANVVADVDEIRKIIAFLGRLEVVLTIGAIRQYAMTVDGDADMPLLTALAALYAVELPRTMSSAVGR